MKKHASVLFIFVLIFSINVNKAIPQDNYHKEEILKLEKSVISKLTGNEEIYPGIILNDRFSYENKKASCRYMSGLFNKFGLESKKHVYSDSGVNVYAVLKSTVQSEEYILLGAHYDSKKNCPGANDNATGTVMVLAAADILTKLENRSKNVIFVLFDEEETGLKGSRAFAKKMKEEDINLIEVHTIDQMGWDGDGDKAIELEVPFEGIHELYTKAAKNLGMDITIHKSRVTSTDHRAFRALGFKAVGLTEEFVNGDTTPHYHKTTDTYVTINFDYLLSSTLLTIEAFKILLK